MSNQRFIEGAQMMRNNIAFLKENSKPWPEVFEHHEIRPANGLIPETIKVNFSTFARILRDGKYYLVHVVESYFYRKGDNTEDLNQDTQKRLRKSVHAITHLYVITGQFEDLDPDQRSEAERITQLYYK